ncbi:uncharacterized protein [Diadema setosum]|uniref:uncharacterized protein n=1 Tax=Diadema setosum TaxID=31175 RepID=UPI003B3B94C7
MEFHHVIVLVVCLASLAASQTTTQQPATCPALPPPANGAVDIVETTATYSCDPGFTLSGSEVRTCESGTWSGTETRCDPTPTPTPAGATPSMAPTQSPSMPMDGADGSTMAAGGSTVTAMMGSEGPATTPMGDGDGDGHEGGNEGGDNDTHMGGDDDEDEDVIDEGLSRGQVALTILATLLILMTITAFGALLWWKYHGTSYVEVDVSHA